MPEISKSPIFIDSGARQCMNYCWRMRLSSDTPRTTTIDESGEPLRSWHSRGDPRGRPLACASRHLLGWREAYRGTRHLLQPRVIRSPVITGDLPILDHKHMDTATGNSQRRTTGVLIDQHDIRCQAAHVLYRPLITGKLRP